MALYRMGTFWDNDVMASRIAERCDVNLEQARNFEIYVRTFCHNLLVNGILNFTGLDGSEKINFRNRAEVQWQLARIITHNVIAIRVYIRALEDVVDYADSGDEHQETKFNPIDNDNMSANLTREDIVQHHTLKSLQDAIKCIPELNRVLEDIYGELSHMCIPVLNQAIISQVETLDLTDYIITTDIDVDELTEQKVIDAFMKANRDLIDISGTIAETLTFDINTSIMKMVYNPFWDFGDVDGFELDVSVIPTGGVNE